MAQRLAGEPTNSKFDSKRPEKEITTTTVGDKTYLDVTSSSAIGLVITNAIDEIAYDLNASAFSETTDISNDYILDNIEFNFSTTESKTITITTSDGTIIWTDTNTNQSVLLSNLSIGFNANDNVTVAVTQFSSSGTMDCILKVKQGTSTLIGNPVLGAGNEIIGKVSIVDENGIVIDSKINPHTNHNELLVNMEGHICEDNSTSTPLGIDGVFTGDWQDTLDYNNIILGINSDQNSTTDGLQVLWGADGITVNDTDTYTILANKPKVFTWTPARRYFKVIYTNNGIAQTVFNIQSMLKRGGIKPSSHRIQDSIVAEDDAELIKAVLTGEGDDGVFRNCPTDLEGKQKINSMDYLFTIAEGDILGHDALLKFGTRTSVAQGTSSVVWEGTSANYPYLTSAQQLKVVSTSADDTATTGTHARTLTLIGLDVNYDEVTETINLAGLTTVTTTLNYLRIFRAYVNTVGVFGNSNAGIIYIRNNAATTIQALITAGDGQTLMTIWTVPRGKVAYILALSTSTNSNKGARVSLNTRLLDGGIFYPFRIRYRAYVFSGADYFPFKIPFKVEEKTDIEVKALTPTSAGTTSFGATFELWYEDS